MTSHQELDRKNQDSKSNQNVKEIRHHLLLWSIILLTTVISLIWIENKFVWTPIANLQKSSTTISSFPMNLDPRVLRSLLTVGGGGSTASSFSGTLLIDAREPQEIVSEGFHPTSILLPFSAIQKVAGKQLQAQKLAYVFYVLLATISPPTLDENFSLFWNFVGIVRGEWNFFFDDYFTSSKTTTANRVRHSFINDILQLVTLNEDEEGTLKTPVDIDGVEVLNQIEFHHPRKIELMMMNTENNHHDDDEFAKIVKEHYGADSSPSRSLNKIMNAETILIVSSRDSTWRSQTAAVLLRKLFFLKNDNDKTKNRKVIIPLKEHFVEFLMPKKDGSMYNVYHRLGFVREDLNAKEGVVVSDGKPKEEVG